MSEMPYRFVLLALCTVSISLESHGQGIPPTPSGKTSEEAAADTPNSAPQLTIETGAFTTAIRALAFSPDGKQVFAAAGADVRVWDVESGELVHTIRGFQSNNSGNITSIAVDPAGDYLAIAVSTSEGGYLRTCHLDAPNETKSYWGDPQAFLEMSPEEMKNAYMPGISVGQRTASQLTFSGDGKYLGFIATTIIAGSDNQFANQSLYIFFDWESDEIIYSGPVSDAPQKTTGAFRGPQGLFMGTNRHYIMPGIDSIFDVQNSVSVDSTASADLQWGFGLIQKMESQYGNLKFDTAMFDGNLPQRKAIYAYSTKRNGRDVYRCDVWSGDDDQPSVEYSQLRWSPMCAALSLDGSIVAVGDALGNVNVFAADTGKTVFKSKSTVDSLYAASLDQSSGIIGLGNRPHSGAAWKLNDYADLNRGFDLLQRQFVDTPEANFPRPKTSLPVFGLQSNNLRGGNGNFVRVKQDGAGDYSTNPIPRLIFSWDLCPGFTSKDALLFHGGGGFVAADFIQLGSPTERFGTTDPGFYISQVSAENSSIATDINHTADNKFITVGWTDGSAAVYQKSDFMPQKLGILPFVGEPLDVTSIRINQFFDEPSKGDLRIGDVLKELNGRPVLIAIQDFFTQPEKHRGGDRMMATIERDGQTMQIPFQLFESPTGGYMPGVAKPALTLIYTKNDDWILFTPEGYYDASLGGHDLVGWKINRGPNQTANHLSARQLRKSLYRPDLIDGVIDAMLTGKRNASVASVHDDSAVDASAPPPVLDLQDENSLASILPPTVSVTGFPDSRQSDRETVDLKIEATSQNDLPVRSIVVLVNGRPPSATPPQPKRMSGGGMLISQTISLSPGDNEIAVIATNSAATSSPQLTTITRTGMPAEQPDAIKPKLYVLAVGVADYKIDDYDLQFAAKDAIAFTDALKAQKGKFYRDVETRVLTDADADRSSIQDGMDWLLGKVTQHDLAIIFLSGHGIHDARRNYYFCSYEVDADRLRSTALANTELVRLTEELPCKVLVFADTCHSGSSRGAKAISQNPWTDIVSEEVGAVLFASSTPMEESLERDDWGHGAFTRAFLDALNEKKTDFNSDGYISITELDLSISERVKELTDGRQHPTTAKPSTIRNFNLAVSGKE